MRTGGRMWMLKWQEEERSQLSASARNCGCGCKNKLVWREFIINSVLVTASVHVFDLWLIWSSAGGFPCARSAYQGNFQEHLLACEFMSSSACACALIMAERKISLAFEYCAWIEWAAMFQIMFYNTALLWLHRLGFFFFFIIIFFNCESTLNFKCKIVLNKAGCCVFGCQKLVKLASFGLALILCPEVIL